jgi:hypothetical protein
MAVRAAVFLITLSGLVFEIGLTRIYSATIWYHFAFVAISVALLGWGLGGVVLHTLRRRLSPTLASAALLTLLYAASIPFCLWLIVQFPFRLERLPLFFLAPLLPFVLAGMVLSMIFQMHRERAAKLYFADLCGAAIGALIVTGLLEELGAEAAVMLSGVPPLAAAACLSPRWRVAGLAGTALISIAAASQERSGFLSVPSGTLKAMPRHMAATPGTRVTQTGWNAYSRIDAVEGFAPPSLARLYIDSDAWTETLEWDGRIESIQGLRDWYRAMPFMLIPGGKTLIIGPGGGSDVLVALASGSRSVTAVELNPLMIDFVRHYRDRAGHLYDRPDVEIIQSEGRTFISRTDRRFDTIFLGFVDTWASVSSGGLSLSENYLYTAESMRAFYDRLSDDGIFAILRWEADLPRLVSNAVALLGAEAAARRIVAIIERRGDPSDPDNPPQMMFLLRKRPFTELEAAAFMEWPLGRPILVPGRHADPPYDDLFAGRRTLAQIVNASPQRIGPVFDDSPFYFARDRPWGLPTAMGGALAAIVSCAVLLLAIFVALGRPHQAARRPYAASIVYFACLGAGFMAVELTLLQYFTLLLGHPVFTLSILLFTILSAGGLGSHLSGHVPTRAACLTVAGVSASAAFLLPRIIPAALPLELAARIAIAVAVLVPLGLAMGMPFPQGLRRTGNGTLPSPPFYWGLNGITSVIGSIGTVLVAVVFGFQVALLAGSACYVLAAAASKAMTHEPRRRGLCLTSGT